MSQDCTIVYIIYEYTCSKYSLMEVNAHEFPCGVLYTRMQGVEIHALYSWQYACAYPTLCVCVCVCVCVCCDARILSGHLGHSVVIDINGVPDT